MLRLVRIRLKIFPQVPNCVRTAQGGKVMEQVTRLNNKELEKFDTMKDVYEEVTRNSSARVI